MTILDAIGWGAQDTYKIGYLKFNRAYYFVAWAYAGGDESADSSENRFFVAYSDNDGASDEKKWFIQYSS